MRKSAVTNINDYDDKLKQCDPGAQNQYIRSNTQNIRFV